ncbi:hypothetical protein GC105_06690 [Alkalibaculum sp. M08DMB]|uniref:PucR C-terminal helix-turn-helix domain-containing protein n=1 Tax=Alkalibaculum sporogenes TaxID=2655001 RepID=A0A6A7K814_9FIRM|nr:helix-turn-helix domain-containing protein [Alkalibaculum sporogenes]MPW25471.1 hypothetical protein [Alkalibaculum sporogenes]
MKFSTSFLINQMQSYNITLKYLKLYNKDTLISSIRIFDMKIIQDDILYVSSIDYANTNKLLPPVIFMAGIPTLAFQDNVVYIDLSFIELFNVLQSIFDKYNFIESRLINAVSENKSLKEILNISSEFFNNPVHILDGSMHYIEYSDNMLMKDHTDAATGKVLTEISVNYTDDSIMNLLREKGLLVQLTHSKNSVYIRLPEVSVAYFSINFFENNTRIAVLSILETISPLDSSQSIIVDQVAHIIANVVKKFRNHPTISSDFKQTIIDLLESRRVDPEILDFYLKKLGWGLNDGYHILKIKMNENSFENGLSEYTIGLIKRYFPKTILLDIDNLVTVMIINANSKSFELKETIEQIRPHLKKQQAIISISRHFINLIKLPEHYKAINDLMVLGKKLSPENNILFHTDFTIAHILSICNRETDIRIFCLPEIFILYEYDKSHGTDFFYSVYIYLKLNKSLAAASKVLLVHRNTLVYRIEKSSKLTGLDFDDCNLTFHVIFSYEIIYYQQLMS